MAQGIVNIEYEKADEYAKATTVAELSVTVNTNEADIANLQETLEEHITEAAETYATQTALAETDANVTALSESLTAHLADTDNPHNVTAAQLGLTTALKYCGTVDTYDSLPTDAEQGDVYNVDDTGANYAWTGEEWDKLSETVDLSNYVTTASLTSILADYATTDYVDQAISGIDLSDYVASDDLASVTVEAISDDDITALFE